MRRLAVAVVVTTLAAGCSSTAQPQDELMVSANPVAATAAQSPAQTAVPPGTVMPLADGATALAVDERSRTLVVAAAQPPRLLLYRLDSPDKPPATVALPGQAETLTSGTREGAVLAAVGSKETVVSVDPVSGTSTQWTVKGVPSQATSFEGATLVSVRDRKEVAVVEDGEVRRVINGGLLSADQVYSANGGAAVLDRLRNAVFELDVRKGTVNQGLRAGQGATNGVADRFGRILVTDTKGGSLLAFSLNPLLLRQRYPLPGAPYAIAYDPKRDLAWVTLTETNEIVGFEVAGGEPRQKYRFATVGQPNSVAVDPESGRVIVASASGGGVQVITP